MPGARPAQRNRKMEIGRMPGIRIDALTDPVVRAEAARDFAALQKLRKATRLMESYFVGMLLKKMRLNFG